MANLIDEIVSQKAFDELERLKRELAEAQKSIEAFYKQTGSMPKFGGAGTATSELEKMVALTKRLTEQIQVYGSVAGKALVEAQQAKRELVNETKLLVQQEQAEEGSINQLRASLNLLTKQYETMGKAAREGLGGKDLHARIMATRTEVDKLEQSLGNYKRNVGNYTNATFQLSQVFRELPAFTFSATTGIMALSNNLPMLADSFKQVSQATDATTGKVNGTMGALKIFGASIFSLGNIFTLAIAALTIFSDKIIALFENTKKSVDIQKEFADAMAEGTKNAYKEQISVESLYNAMTNTNKSMDERVDAMKKLRDEYPAYFKDLTDEEMLTGKAGEAYKNLANDILSVAKARVVEQKIADIYSETLDEEIQLKEKLQKLSATEQLNRGKSVFMTQSVSPTTGVAQGVNLFGAEADKYREQLRKNAQTELYEFYSNRQKRLNIFKEFLDKERTLLKSDPEKEKKDREKSETQKREVDRIDILRKEFEREKALLETKLNDGLILEEDYEKELIDLTKKYTAQREGLSEKEKQSEADFNRDLSKIRRDILDENLKKLMALEEEFNKWSEKSTKELNDKYIKELERKRKHNEYWAKEELDLIKGNIDAMEKMFEEDDKQTEKERQKALERLAIVEDYFKQFQELAQIYTDAINAKESSAFDIKTEKMKEFYDEEEQRINRSYTNQKDREIELQKLSARKRADEKALDIERKKMLKEQAMRQKKADVMAAISGAALMIIKQSIATPLPTGLPFILAAGVTGGLQVAKAMAAPIPEFAKGTESSPEGYAVVGEKGHELVIEPSGKKWVTPAKDTITYLRKGSKVIPNDKLMTMVRDSAYVELANMNMPVTPDLYGKALVDQFERLSDDVKDLKAVMSNKDMRVNIVGNFDHYMHVKRNIK